MKTFISFTTLLCVIALPVNAQLQLTDADLNKIRLIVKDEVETEITASEKRIKEYVDTKFESVDKQFASMDKRITQSNNILYALIALIIFAIGLPAWQNRKDREDKKKIEALTQRLEAIEQQQNTVNP